MGVHNTKNKNDDLKEIGKKANKENPNSFADTAVINLTNSVIVGQSKSDPSKDYKKKQFLGEGSFASVYLVQSRLTDAIRAMKIISKSSNTSEEDEQEIINEINILKIMDHPNILKIFEFYSSKESYSIVTEFCSGGELFQEITDNGPFNERYSAYVMFQIFSAINYCHNMNIIAN